MSQAEKTFLIVTGLSGAGKTQTSKVLEDIGFFCVDNLPAPLISRFAELLMQSEGNINKVCMVVDLRGESFLSGLDDALAILRGLGIHYQILFLDASDEVLVRRFKENRRTHPQSIDGTILSGIRIEREKLKPFKKAANITIDTSQYSTKDLKEAILSYWNSEDHQITVGITSFGFKHGVPIDADIIMDVRFVTNPYYVPALRDLTGRDCAVQEYVFSSEEAKNFLKHFTSLILELLPLYVREGKNHLSVGIGCTGGQHRSIAMAIALSRNIDKAGYKTMLSHRDH